MLTPSTPAARGDLGEDAGPVGHRDPQLHQRGPGGRAHRQVAPRGPGPLEQVEQRGPVGVGDEVAHRP